MEQISCISATSHPGGSPPLKRGHINKSLPATIPHLVLLFQCHMALIIVESRELRVVQAKRLSGVQTWMFCGGSILRLKTARHGAETLQQQGLQLHTDCSWWETHTVLERLGTTAHGTWR